jgi:rhodanese-related sulfurtransferase
MQLLTEFVTNHWILFVALVVILVLLLWNIISAKRGGAEMGPAEVTQLINREDAVVIDVRDKAQYAKGHIVGAINMPMPELSQRMKELDKFRDRPIILCCQMGDTSSGAGIALMKASRLPKLYRLRGGILAWQNLNLPLTKG